MIIPSDAKPPSYRLQRGTKLADIVTSVPTLSSLDGPFQLAEYLSLKVRNDPHDVKGLVEVPTASESGEKAPERDVWIYEHLRRIPIDLTPLLTQLLGICGRESCPQMKADEWLYLCVAHDGGGTEECCAIDYIFHTLDTTTALLNSSKSFPSRLNIPSASLSHFPSLFRRLSRIFSHAYFHHREAFSLAESETSLYARFVALCERYELVGPGLLVIPRDAVRSLEQPEDAVHEEKEEGSDDSEEDDEDEDEDERIGNRGRDAEGKTEEKRTRSLDRALRPSVSLEHRARASLPSVEASSEDPHDISTIREDRGGMTMGRGTKGRGKQSRGSMLWSSDAPPVPEKRAVETAPEDTSTESLESLMHVGSTSEKQEAELSPVPTPPLSVPKDKIDLLEEEGKISPRFDVPLVDQPAMPIVEEGEEEDEEGMEEVELEEAEKDEEAEQKLDQDATSHLLISEDAMEEPEDQGTLDAKSSTEESPANAQTPAVCDFASEEKEVGDEEEVLDPSEADEVDKANDEAKEAI